MRLFITILIWTLSIFTLLGEVAIIRTTPGAIKSLAPKDNLPTENERDPFGMVWLKPPMVANPINSLIPGAAHDIKQWLKDNGVEMETKDLALCIWDKDLIVVRSSSKTINSIRMLVEFTGEGDRNPPLEVILRVREGMEATSKDICRFESITRSGYKLPNSDVDYEVDIELTLSSDGDWVDASVGFVGRAELAGKSVSTHFMTKIGEEVKVASWAAHEKSTYICLKVLPHLLDKPSIPDAKLFELTQKVTKALGE